MPDRRRAGPACTVAACLALAACQAGLGSTPEPPSPFAQQYVTQFNAIDAQRKGVITWDQAIEHYNRRFGELDANRDGFLDANELAPMLPLMNAKTPGELVVAFDRNGDNKVTRQEFQVVVNWLFQRAASSDRMTLAEAEGGTRRGIKMREMPTDKLPDNR